MEKKTFDQVDAFYGMICECSETAYNEAWADFLTEAGWTNEEYETALCVKWNLND